MQSEGAVKVTVVYEEEVTDNIKEYVDDISKSAMENGWGELTIIVNSQIITLKGGHRDGTIMDSEAIDALYKYGSQVSLKDLNAGLIEGSPPKRIKPSRGEKHILNKQRGWR